MVCGRQARASADIVLTEPGLGTIVDAIIIARRIFRRIAAFLNYRIAATLQLLLFFFIAVFAFEPQRYNPAVRACPCTPCRADSCADLGTAYVHTNSGRRLDTA
jgi:cation transport ATPase